jgi:hypothetical protein
MSNGTSTTYSNEISEELLIVTFISSILIILFTSFYLFKFNYSSMIMFLIMFIIIIVLINFSTSNKIYDSFNSSYTKTFTSTSANGEKTTNLSLYATILFLFVVLLILYLVELYYKQFINSEFYPFYIAIMVAVITFIIYSFTNQQYDLTMSQYVHLFAIELVVVIFMFLILYALYYNTIGSNIIIISSVFAFLAVILIILYFNPEIIEQITESYSNWINSGSPTANLFRSIPNTIKKEIFTNSPLIWLILIIQFVVLYLFFNGNDVSHNIIKFLTHDGKHLMNDVEYINKTIYLGKFQDLTNIDNTNTDTENNDTTQDDVNYNYAISGWFYLNPQYNTEGYIPVFNYGEKPLIAYKGSDNTLKITVKNTYNNVNDKNEDIIINDFKFQKWNNIVINCRSGQYIDVIINTKLVSTQRVVISDKTVANVEVGHPDLEGAACNIVYYNRNLPIWSIYTLYFIYSSMDPPYINYSKSVEEKERNKNLNVKDFKSENEKINEKNKQLTEKYDKYERDASGNIIYEPGELLKNMPGTHKVNTLLWPVKFF